MERGPDERSVRLLPETGVPTGLPCTDDRTRLIYAPGGEPPGCPTFDFPQMAMPAGPSIAVRSRQRNRSGNNTFRKLRDGEHRWPDLESQIFEADHSHKCPTCVHRTPPCQGSCPSGETDGCAPAAHGAGPGGCSWTRKAAGAGTITHRAGQYGAIRASRAARAARAKPREQGATLRSHP